jgi:hypothetical protein
VKAVAKKTRPASAPKPASDDKPVTLKDLLSNDVLDKLKAQADAMKAEEEKLKEENRKRAADARKSELKRLENDFGHLLENSSMDWRKHK